MKAFQATLERTHSRLNWVFVRIPFDVSKIWGTRGHLRVKGEISGFEFRASLYPMGDGHHALLVTKKMQAGGKVGVGSVARFRLEPDTERRVVTMPPEFERALSEVRGFRRWYDRLPASMRNYFAKWISDVKSPEARGRRADHTAERLLETMEAERELPPILEIAFAANPRAREGWKRMSPSRRRSHLYGVFYYRSPEARARRVAKAVRDAVEVGERNEKQMSRKDAKAQSSRKQSTVT